MKRVMQNFLMVGTAAFFLMVGVTPLRAEGSGEPQVRQDMAAVYQAFKSLQKYMSNRNEFVDSKNEAQIGDLLGTMSTRFHRVEALEPRYSAEPGFATTVKVINDMLDDVKHRFDEGKKEYALWRLKTSYNYCVSCHTRFEVTMDFHDASPDLVGLNHFERGEFLLATRQFDSAGEEYLKSIQEPAEKMQRVEALRRWVLLYTRVHPDPQEAIRVLTRIRSKVALTTYEDGEISAWLLSLRRWQNESKVKLEPLRKAEHLINQGVAINDGSTAANGTVELLRGTALLHQLMDESAGSVGERRAKVLYLLGLAYSSLPPFFANELPEVFLEQCIRENPGSEMARKAYLLLTDVISNGYTGSGGTKLPAEVVALFKELHAIAYGEIGFKEQV